MITRENIEAYLLDLIEGNLSPEKIKELEAFLKENPNYREMINRYDPSLVLIADRNIKFEDKESLRRKNKSKSIYPFIKYSFIAIAACFILFLFVSKLFIKPLENTSIKNFDKVIVKNTNNTLSPSSSINNDKEEIVKKQTRVTTNKTKTIEKAQKPQEKEIPIELKEELKPEPKILLSNSMVVYELDNLIVYIEGEEFNKNKIIEVDNLIAYKDSPIINPLLSPLIYNKYVYQLRYNLENTIEKTQSGFNNALVYIQENVKFNQLELVIAKK